MSKVVASQNEDVNTFVKVLKSMAPNKRTIDVFSDWIKCAAYAFINATNYSQQRENEYKETLQMYSKEDQMKFPRLLALVADGLTKNYCDFLGEAYMGCDMGNAAAGQFFTPYSVSLATAKISIGKVKDMDSIITIGEPSCGSGGMIIAAAEVLRDQGFPFQKNMLAFMGDIDIDAVYMSIIHCSLLGIPAVIQHTNTLTQEVYAEFETPACAMWLVRERYEAQCRKENK